MSINPLASFGRKLSRLIDYPICELNKNQELFQCDIAWIDSNLDIVADFIVNVDDCYYGVKNFHIDDTTLDGEKFLCLKGKELLIKKMVSRNFINSGGKISLVEKYDIVCLLGKINQDIDSYEIFSEKTLTESY